MKAWVGAALSMAQAGAAALAGTFALVSVESLALKDGERVLIQGANGGVAAFAGKLSVV